MTKLLIDADLILYKSVAAAEYEADWGEGVFVASTNINQAKDMVHSQIEAIQRELGSDDIALILSGKNNFRYGLTETYKSNRKGTRKPLGYKALEEWLYGEFPGQVAANDLIEADDYLGILATKPGAGDCIIVSDDKDMQTIPCKLFRLGGLSTIDEDAADRYWWTQTLTGDPADGYKGCPGVGPVKAQKILDKPGSRWENVRQEFLKAGLDEEFAVLQARLARILRFDDWDSASKTVRLWTPSAH